MFDQSLSAKNFRKIVDYENRKGRFLEGRFFPELETITSEIKANFGQLRELRKRKSAEVIAGTYYDNRKTILIKRSELKKAKEQRLMELLEVASAEATKPTFSIGIKSGSIVNNKRVYTSGETAPSYLALKQLQRNIRNLYRVRQGHRHWIICQLREMLSDSMPKLVIRLDFTGFYENIPRNILLRRLSHDPLLNVASKKLITGLLWEFKDKFGMENGLPRGIGISAYLAELFMRDFDEAIRRIRGVVYYARYVDDIVVIVVPQPNQDIRSIFEDILRCVRRFGLKRNRSKSNVINSSGKSLCHLDFLGYRFTFGNTKINLSLTDGKLNRYKTRIIKSFKAYERTPIHSKSLARELLIRRICYLTGNTRLLNNKRNAMVGIYFSNSLLSSASEVRGLDNFLKHHIDGLADKRLQARLSKLKFEDGFIMKRFHRYSVKAVSDIVRVWKYVT